MKLKAKPFYVDATDKQHIEQNLITYIRNARTAANNYNPGGGAAGPVTANFGNLSANQKATLVAKLDRMILALGNYTFGGKTFEREVEICESSGTELYSSGQVGAAYASGVADVNKHFKLRVYVGMTFRNAGQEDKYHLIVHELSPRILATADVDNAVCSGVDGTKCYLRAKVTALAGASPDDALNNADSFAYFVDACNNLATVIY